MHKAKRKPDDHQGMDVVGLTGTILRGTFSLVRWAVPGILYAAGWTIWGIWYSLRHLWHAIWRFITWPFRMVWRVLRYIFVGRVPDSFASKQQEEAFWRIKRQYRRRNFFILHIFVYLSVLAMITVDAVNLYRRGFQTSVTESLGFIMVWTFFMIFHFVRMRMGDAEDQALRAIMEEGLVAQHAGKRKRRHLDEVLNDLNDDELAVLRRRLTDQPQEAFAYHDPYMDDDGEMWQEQ